MRLLPCQGRNKTSPGTSSVKHLEEENIAAASLKLDDAEWKAIEDDAKQK
jgi:aryl-alcohol dehydrogenase-like predicted oxidoreductase